MRLNSAIVPAALLATAVAAAQSPALRSVWPAAKVQAILERTGRTRLAPDLSHLTAGERIAVAKLLQVGQMFQDIYELQRHSSALIARAGLENAAGAHSK